MRLLPFLIVGLLGAGTARAEIIVVRGVELKVPADWVEEPSGDSATLIRPKAYKGRALTVLEVPEMPKNAAAFGKLFDGTEKLAIESVKDVDRDGVTLVWATGKFQAAKPIMVDILAVPVGSKGVLLISGVGADTDPLIRKANTDVLMTARIPGPRLTATYKAGTTTVGPSKAFIASMTKVIEAIDHHTRLPRPLPVKFEQCDEINAFYSPRTHTITMCHDLYDDLVALFQKTNSKQKAVELAQGTMIFTFFHELGHALVGEFGLPITGKGEDAADELATLVLVQLGPAGHSSALAAAAWFDTMAKDPDHSNIFWDEHSFDEQRVVTIVCLLYGSDPAGYQDKMKELKIPAQRLYKCERDYPARKQAWDTLLAPYNINPTKK